MLSPSMAIRDRATMHQADRNPLMSTPRSRWRRGEAAGVTQQRHGRFLTANDLFTQLGSLYADRHDRDGVTLEDMTPIPLIGSLKEACKLEDSASGPARKPLARRLGDKLAS